MSGTDIAYAATCLRARYLTSGGTSPGYCHSVGYYGLLCLSYGMRGTELGYDATEQLGMESAEVHLAKRDAEARSHVLLQ
eukprot:3592150-Rhodomonas_salina.1